MLVPQLEMGLLVICGNGEIPESARHGSRIAEQIELDIVYHIDMAEAAIHDDHARFHAAAMWLCNQFGLTKLNVSIAIVDDATIRSLNRRHLHHDWPTDVISFLFTCCAGAVEGEIIASAEMATRTCPSAGWAADDELLLYVVHGLLHLVGLDDIEPDQGREMRRMESACMLAIGVARADEHLRRWDTVFADEFDE